MKEKRTLLIGTVLGALLVLIVLVSSFLLARQNELLKAQIQDQTRNIEQQAELLESIRKSRMVALLGNLLDKVDDELQNNPKRILSEEIIARIAAWGNASQPYAYWEGDSLSEKKLSPERGQLLLVLSIMKIDSSSFDQVKATTSFSGADMSGADLRGANLGGVELQGANLKDADLAGANLGQADLRKVNLWGANLRKANLGGADLKRAFLSWADLTGANLTGADLNGIDLTNANLREADLKGANLQWAYLEGALFSEANVSGVDFLATDLSRVNLSGAVLCDANLTRTNLSEANLSGAELVNAAVQEENWLEKLQEWQVTGAKEIQDTYIMVEDTSGLSKYRLKKIEEEGSP